MKKSFSRKWDRLQTHVRLYIDRWYKAAARRLEAKSLPFLAIWSVALTLLVEILSRRSPIDAVVWGVLHPYIMLFNAMIVFVSLIPSVLFPRRMFALTTLSSVWLVLGVTNCVVLGMRNTPLAAIDFGLVVSCLPIVTVYLKIWQIILIIAAIALLIVLLVFLYRCTPISAPRPLWRRICAVAASALILTVTVALSVHTGAIPTKFADLPGAYKDYGFVYCFGLSVVDRGVDRPDDYSGEKVGSILDAIDSGTAETETSETPPADTAGPISDPTHPEDSVSPPQQTTDEKPNVIFIQLESFFDVNRLQGMTFSEDPVPVFTSLKKEYPSGLLSVPSIGAGTANTEFEVLTGMNLDHFGAGEYPYKTILRSSTCESIAYNLKAAGYATHAMHNNSATFYNRNTIYPSLGFDTFISLEYMQDVEYNPLGWAKDKVLTGEIRTVLDATPGPDFVFAVSVQPHGKYPDDTAEPEDDTVNPTLLDRLFGLFETGNETETEESEGGSSAGGNLTGNVETTLTREELAAQKIRVSGIADPQLAAQYTYYVNQLYETDAFIGALIAELSASGEPSVLVLYGDHLPAFNYMPGDMADGSTLFQTDYVVWSNLSTPLTDKDLETWQLSSAVLGALGIREGTVNQLHQKYADTDTDYGDSLQILEYDMLYGDRAVWGGVSPYLPTSMKMGILPITLLDTQQLGASLYVNGTGFTAFSQITVNGKKVPTVYVDSHTLYAEGQKPKSGDRIAVVQAGSDKIVLGTSDSLIYTP